METSCKFRIAMKIIIPLASNDKDFENKYGKLSRSQRRYIAMKVEKRINEMRDEYFEKNN